MLAVVIFMATLISLKTLPSLEQVATTASQPLLLDRYRQPLYYQVRRDWNVYDQAPLHNIPPLLQQAFIFSEDKRFYSHHGVDWQAKLHAMWEDLRAMHIIRGASSITEQVVRIVHTRPRTIWSKWIEAIEAYFLEIKETKLNILEFYLNQVPYANEHRGIVQASRYYFNRDIDTLSPKEMLALVVMARAPSAYDLFHNYKGCESRILQLNDRLYSEGVISEAVYQQIKTSSLQPTKTPLEMDTYHFAHFVWSHIDNGTQRLTTTLDSNLQLTVKKMLDKRIEQLAGKNVHNGAVLVVDHQTNEILAWAVAGDIKQETNGSFVDALLTPRQPGSTLKPFIYTLALEKGWTAATIIKDEPLQTVVGNGLHSYKNYSRVFYGDLTVRESLANSLNIPAVKALDYVGINTALDTLHRLGIKDLARNPSVYGVGLALGNGEVSLYELVQAYTALANKGIYRPLRFKLDEYTPRGEAVFSPEVTSIVSSIISDNISRQLEFGDGNSLFFAVDTAAKTGTSTDYRDAWIVAYNYRYMVGIWMGNLDREPMSDVTGSTGPALLAHSIFTELNRNQETKALYVSPKLSQRRVCVAMPYENSCVYRDEWFVPGTEPVESSKLQKPKLNVLPIQIQKPSDDLDMAIDPRIPDQLEAFEFSLNQHEKIKKVDWYVDGVLIASTDTEKYLWSMVRGKHVVKADVLLNDGDQRETPTVNFTVK